MKTNLKTYITLFASSLFGSLFFLSPMVSVFAPIGSPTWCKFIAIAAITSTVVRLPSAEDEKRTLHSSNA